MPSQDDFLDDLLKDVDLDNGDVVDIDSLDDFDIDSLFGLDETQTMSADEIEKMLLDTQESAKEQDALQQTDNHDAIDQDIMALLQDATEEAESIGQAKAEAEKISDINAELDLSAEETTTKKTKEERKAEKVAAKEAKKAAKAAKKAAKKNKNKEEEVFNLAQNSTDSTETIQEISQEDLAELDELMDVGAMADLDELLNMAGNTMKSTGVNLTTDAKKTDAEKDALVEGVVAEKRAEKKKEKKGFLTRLMDFLMEEEEEQEKGNEDIQLSEENKTVINELDKGKKKKKPKKDKKNKKDVDKKAAADGEENAEEGAEEKKEKKTKKEKKPKKEKVLTQEMLDEELRENKATKISFKKILPIAMVCLSFGVVIVLVSELTGDYSAKRIGRKAYMEEDYQTCYQNLYGKELNESEQVMYSKSESILRIRLWIREYELFVEEGAEAEALDSLIQSVANYPVLYEYASKWNAGTEVAELYNNILQILSDKYHLTEVQALEINSIADDAEYSKRVYAIVDGNGFGSWDLTEEEIAADDMADILPEEEELSDITFTDNN